MSDILKLIIDMMFLSVKIIVLEITEGKKESYSVSFVQLGLTMTVWEDYILSPHKWHTEPRSFLVTFRWCCELLLARGLKSVCITYISNLFDNILFV